MKDRLRPELRVSAILPCRVARTRLSREVVEQLRERFGELVLQTVSRENVRVAEAPSWKQPITTYALDSHGAADYRAVAGELLARVRRSRQRWACLVTAKHAQRILNSADCARQSYFASGLGRNWNFTALLVWPLPPS